MRVDAKSREKATTILQLLVWTEQELELCEVVDALAIRKNKHGLHYEPRSNMPIPEEIVKLLPGLIILDTSKDMPWNKITVVRLAHCSVKEYLTSDYVFETFKASLEEYNAHIAILDMCMLQFRTFQGFEDESWAEFTSYSRDCWLTHARIAQADNSALERIVGLLMSGQEPGNPFYNCVLLCEPHFLPENGDPQPWIMTPLWYASNLGLDRAVSRLLESGTQTIDTTCGESETTALEIATANCHEETVRLLLAYGATPLMTSLPYPTESTEALRILKLLHEYGAKPTFSILQEAVDFKSAQLVRFLLDCGADPNAPDMKGWSPLMKAAYGGNREVVALLLESGVDALVRDNQGSSAFDIHLDQSRWYKLTGENKDESNIYSMLLAHMWKQRRSAQAATKRRRQSRHKALLHRDKIQKREHYGLTFHEIHETT
jgi:hypothetical protein